MAKRKSEVFSIFGEIEAMVAKAMVDEHKLNLIPQAQVPPTALFDGEGRKAHFAVVIPAAYRAEYEERVEQLRA